MKNLEFPEKIFEIPSSVTSLGFSKQSPNLLAVGVHTGFDNLIKLIKFHNSYN